MIFFLYRFIHAVNIRTNSKDEMSDEQKQDFFYPPISQINLDLKYIPESRTDSGIDTDLGSDYKLESFSSSQGVPSLHSERMIQRNSNKCPLHSAQMDESVMKGERNKKDNTNVFFINVVYGHYCTKTSGTKYFNNVEKTGFYKGC